MTATPVQTRTFEEHLRECLRDDGTYDLDEAVQRRAEDLREDPESIEALVLKAAQQERRAFEARNRKDLATQFSQDSLPGLDVEACVPLGDSILCRLGAMNAERIRTRKDLRTEFHLDEARAFDKEMSFWLTIEKQIGGGTIDDLVTQGGAS